MNVAMNIARLLVTLLVALSALLAAGCATTSGIPENCEVRHKGVCYMSERAACEAARCPLEHCTILRSYPGQVECNRPTESGPR